MNILVTGGAGFIGSHLCKKLLDLQHSVIAIDNFDPFYSKKKKEQNIAPILSNKNFNFIEADILDDKIYSSLSQSKFDVIFHLAAKAGVRPSISNPIAYEEVNVKGTLNLLEFAKTQHIDRFIFASSSSVYGVNPHFPWNEDNTELMPISPYASTKLSCEHLGYTYSHLYNIVFTALRLFTVYGPSQRPDLAIHKFFKSLYTDQPIEIYGSGESMRDYTYIEDILTGFLGALHYTPQKKFNVFNIGGHSPIKLIDLVRTIERITGKKFQINFIDDQQGDVPVTYADIEKAKKELNYSVTTSLEQGLKGFKNWFEKEHLNYQ